MHVSQVCTKCLSDESKSLIHLVVEEEVEKKLQPNFSLMQSNIFFLLFNFIVPFAIDFSIQFYRNQRLSNSALCLIILFAINCFLWFDFNVQMVFKKQPQLW